MKKYQIFGLLVLNAFYGYSQEADTRQGDKKYDDYAFIDAVKTYERIADKGYRSADLFKKLGNSYYFNSNFEAAAKWYGELFALDKDPEADYYHRYAQSLKATGKQEKADLIMGEFSANHKDDARAKLQKENAGYLNQIKANSGRYKIEDAGINSKYSDYGSFVYDNKIYFTSARDTGNFSQRKHKWTGEYFTSIYSADLEAESGKASKINKIKPEINSRFNESSAVFAKDGKTAYFTRNSFLGGKKGKDGSKNTLVKIYQASLENGRWTKVTALPFTSDDYNTAHPALSPDGKTMYFASDMPGTIGQSDIYKVTINGDGSFGKPVNMGKSINTEGKETFPYVTSENEIYLASDGHPGLGGLDVFAGHIEQDGTISRLQNLGSDINSPKDDFAYIIDPVSRQGYFSTNKDGGQGSDDIYKFLETEKLKYTEDLQGVLTDSESGTVIPNAVVTLYKNDKVIGSVITDNQGRYSFETILGSNYVLRFEIPGYSTKELAVTSGKTTGKTGLTVSIDKAVHSVAVRDDLSKSFGIKLIYFDLNKSTIRTEEVIDLEKILDVLNQNPKMKLDVRSHTDSRASHRYNQALSDRRVKSTIEWLVKNGVDKKRLTGKGYGETQLLNQCADGVNCTEEDHQVNRRSEFIITAL